MRPRPAAMGEDVGVVAADFFEGVGEEGEAVESAVGVNQFRELSNVGRDRSGVDDYRPEWIAENITQYICLPLWHIRHFAIRGTQLPRRAPTDRGKICGVEFSLDWRFHPRSVP